jgi:hypothetical protein
VINLDHLSSEAVVTTIQACCRPRFGRDHPAVPDRLS